MENNHLQPSESEDDLNSFVCEVCELPYHECLCYELCETCELPSNECLCNAYIVPGNNMPMNQNLNNKSYEWVAPERSSPSQKRNNAPQGICVYYTQGRCSYGNTCKFSHDIGTSSNSGSSNNSSSSDLCKFYASGNCRFGDTCRFSHSVKINQPSGNQGTDSGNTSSRSFDSNPEFLKRKEKLKELSDEIAMLEDLLSEKRDEYTNLEMDIQRLSIR